VILAALGIVSFLLLNVVPKMLGVFAQTGQMLPLATRILLTISDGLGHYGFYLLGLLAVGVFLFIRLMRGIPFRVGVEKLLFKIALVGKAIRLINTARFSHTLAILTAAGVDVIEAMRVATNIIGNISIRRKLEIATRQVSEGVAIHRALKETGFFPPMSIYLIASGENSGQLEDMLERAARMQENQVERTIDILLTVFEPLMILIMGSMVLFIVLAILLPIFDLDQFIQ
jgi:general secretion pathway protein F